MTTFDTHAHNAIWQDDEWYLDDEGWEDMGIEGVEQWETWHPRPSPITPERVMFTAVGLILFIAIMMVLNQPATSVATLPPQTQSNEEPEPAAPAVVDPASFGGIYDDYILTQGPHGMSYGHYAIDLAAGNGAPIKSPISGTITQLYTDQWGNPTLVVENDVYQVMFLHGNYTVTLGQEIAQGDLLGTESNHGNTYDMAGNSCRGRNCGYHTHLNVYDKRLGANINPLDVLP